MNGGATKPVPRGRPRDQFGTRHYCHDETANVVNDRWFCQCPGGPYFVSGLAVRRHKKRKETSKK